MGMFDDIGAPDRTTPATTPAVGGLFSDISTDPKALPGGPAQPRSFGEGLARQLGLTARYGIEGPAQGAEIFTEPLRKVTDLFLPERQQGLNDLVLGNKPAPKSKPLGQVATDVADWLGLPKPENALERVIGDASRNVAGVIAGGRTAGLAGEAPAVTTAASQTLPRYLPRSAPDFVQAVKSVPSLLNASPLASATSAAGAGLLGGSAREAELSPLVQFGASLAGGLGGGFVPSMASGGAGMVRRLATPNMSTQELDQRLTGLLAQNGTDYNLLPPAARVALRNEVTPLLQAGKEIDPEALGRLASLRAVGATPTRGMVSQEPGQLTREKNAAKLQANLTNSASGLSTIENENNRALIGSLNDLGGNRTTPINAGRSALDAINTTDQLWQGRVNQMYGNARAMPGGDTQLARAPLINDIYSRLTSTNDIAHLPDSVGRMLNNISYGQVTLNGQTHRVPFDANTLDNLYTTIATAQRGTTDGNVKRALGHVRDALDAHQLTPEAGPGAAPTAFMDALRNAKETARQRFQWRESSPPVESALAHGAQPDNFIDAHIVGGTVADARALAREAPIGPTRDAIVAHLKTKALNGATDEFGNFSQANYQKALANIGEEKLRLFFSPEEIQQMHNVGKAGSSMLFQPRGSAVGHSNTSAMNLGALGNKIPFSKHAQLAWNSRGMRDPTKGLLGDVAGSGVGAAPFLLSGAVSGTPGGLFNY